jgi:hypothetical protein
MHPWRLALFGLARISVSRSRRFPHHPREVLPPLAEHRLVDVESPPVDALGLDDRVHVRVLLWR